MKATKSKFKDSQLYKEGRLQKVSAEQRAYVEASACQRIAHITDNTIANLPCKYGKTTEPPYTERLHGGVRGREI